MKNTKNDNNWITILGEACILLTIVFCAFRACDLIQWDWYFILLPLILYLVLCAATLVILLIAAAAVTVSMSRLDKERK